ncbi:winged helix-turn-helix domain-containing protein [Vibrio maritimus]|uniref:winged helix-turn-helix domain-containing protein n=1 Tax=Vibrio maritimus TaxID=990268 RepID=UPI001F2B56DA|nr:winged helix-turn-helix domain-containing protein [Vibrio maritimus]
MEKEKNQSLFEGKKYFNLDGKIFYENGLVLDAKTERLVTKISEAQFRILFNLFESEGVIMSKQELIHKGWQGSVVSEGCLLMAIFSLRQLLKRNYIITVRGIGYYFMLPQSIKVQRECVHH